MARDWPTLPIYQSESEVPQIEGWRTFQIESIYEPIDAGRRYEQRSVQPLGAVPVLDQSATGYLGYHNDDPGVEASPEDPIVTFANHTCEMRLMREPFSTIQNIFPMKGRAETCISNFFYYATKGRVRLSEYKGHHPIFRRMWIAIPPLSVQQAIAEVLGALDDKIAANTKLARTADELVRARFASLESRAQAHVQVREIVGAANDKIEPSALSPLTPYIGLEHVPRRMMWLSEFGTSESVTSTKSVFAARNVLFGKLRPYFHKIVGTSSSGICSTDILVLRPLDEELFGFALAALASDAVVQSASSASEGTRMPRTSWKDLASIEVPWPGRVQAEHFSGNVTQLHNAATAALGENRTLASTRDALLPQLMSGRLRVKDAEAVAESVL